MKKMLVLEDDILNKGGDGNVYRLNLMGLFSLRGQDWRPEKPVLPIPLPCPVGRRLALRQSDDVKVQPPYLQGMALFQEDTPPVYARELGLLVGFKYWDHISTWILCTCDINKSPLEIQESWVDIGMFPVIDPAAANKFSIPQLTYLGGGKFCVSWYSSSPHLLALRGLRLWRCSRGVLCLFIRRARVYITSPDQERAYFINWLAKPTCLLETITIYNIYDYYSYYLYLYYTTTY